MSQPRKAVLRLTSFAGGLNNTDPTHRIGDDQLAVASDVLLTTTGVQRRPGAQVCMPPPTTSGGVYLLARHTPNQNLANTEVWAFPAGATFKRSTSGTTWTDIAAGDTAAGGATGQTDAVSFNGKLYVAYKKQSGLDRLHCWDGAAFRRVGLATSAAPTVANTGSGSYGAVLRYYRVQFVTTDVTAAKRTYSELSPVVSFTPSGSGTHARITRPTAVESATHWIVWASSDNVSYYVISGATVIATTTFDDNYAPSEYATVSPSQSSPQAGEFTPPWSAKYLLVDDNRLLIAGSHENALYGSRVGWSAIGGTASAATGLQGAQDDERFPTRNYLDLDSDEGGELTGMAMLNGSVYVFKRYAIYKLVRTGNGDRPYVPVPVSKSAGIGALSRHSIVPGDDEAGQPCLYFLSERGPYRLSASGVQYMGRDIEALWATVAQRGLVNGLPHGVYDATAGRLHYFVTRAVANGNDVRLTFHVKLGRQTQDGIRGGWVTTSSTSKPMYASASVALPSDLSNRDTPLVPCAAHTNGAWSYPPVIWSYATSAIQDDTVNTSTGAVTGAEPFTPVIATKTFSLGLGQYGGVDDVYVLCQPAASTSPSLSVSLVRDFGAETRTKAQVFTAATARLPLQIPDLTMAQAQYVSVGITSATQQAWTVDEIALRVRQEDPV